MKNMWHINTQKQVRAWFSQEHHVFLDLENQCRLVGIRQLHEGADFTFIYSSMCLSSEAHRELTFFCQEHNIRTINFDTDIRQMLEHCFDIKLYEYIKNELTRFGKGVDKSLLAAMQCIPLIVPIYEKFGIYSNFQSSIDFRNIPKILKVLAPILLPYESIAKMGIISDPNVNNHLLIMAFDEENPDVLCIEAINTVRDLQEQMINTYSQNNDLSLSLSKIQFSMQQVLSSGIQIKNESRDFYSQGITDAIQNSSIDNVNIPDYFPIIIS